MVETLLKVAGLQSWYGESHILHGVDFEIRRGELVTLLGRNGAGKTTTLKSIMGIVGKRTGSIAFEGGSWGRRLIEPVLCGLQRPDRHRQERPGVGRDRRGRACERRLRRNA